MKGYKPAPAPAYKSAPTPAYKPTTAPAHKPTPATAYKLAHEQDYIDTGIPAYLTPYKPLSTYTEAE